MDRVTEAFAAAVKAAIAASGVKLSEEATAALVASLDADESNRFLSRYIEHPPHDLVAARVAQYLSKNSPKPDDLAPAHADTCGVPPELWAKMSALNRLTAARTFAARQAGENVSKAEPKNFRTKRLEADLHGARLRLRTLKGAERQTQIDRIATLESELAAERGAGR